MISNAQPANRISAPLCAETGAHNLGCAPSGFATARPASSEADRRCVSRAAGLSMPCGPVVSLRRPVTSLSGAKDILNKDRNGVVALIEDGTLRAFNLASEINTHMTYRILSEDLERYQRGEAKPSSDFESALKLIFPICPELRVGVIATIPANMVASRLSVSTDHLFVLVERGLLRFAPGSKPRRGPGNSPKIEWASVFQFLKKRYVI